MTDKKKCAHPACQCVPAGDEKYCSQYCEDAGTEDVEISCDCGHEGCALDDSVPTGTTLPVEFA